MPAFKLHLPVPSSVVPKEVLVRNEDRIQDIPGVSERLLESLVFIIGSFIFIIRTIFALRAIVTLRTIVILGTIVIRALISILRAIKRVGGNSGKQDIIYFVDGTCDPLATLRVSMYYTMWMRFGRPLP